MATSGQQQRPDQQEQQRKSLLERAQAVGREAAACGLRLVMAGNTVSDATAVAEAADGGPDPTQWTPEQALRHVGDVATADTILAVRSKPFASSNWLVMYPRDEVNIMLKSHHTYTHVYLRTHTHYLCRSAAPASLSTRSCCHPSPRCSTLSSTTARHLTAVTAAAAEVASCSLTPCLTAALWWCAACLSASTTGRRRQHVSVPIVSAHAVSTATCLSQALPSSMCIKLGCKQFTFARAVLAGHVGLNGTHICVCIADRVTLSQQQRRWHQ
jgi:hypothetical protein